MLMRLSAEKAVENLKSTAGSRWNEDAAKRTAAVSAASRLTQPAFKPVVHPRFRFPADARIFVMGSCFAHNLEKALINRGFDIPHPGSELASLYMVKGTKEPALPWAAAAYLNKYNTYSMLYEVRRACLGPDAAPEMVIPMGRDRWMDIGAANMLTDDTEAAVRKRRAILDVLSSRAKDCDVFVLTLGLTEGWYHKRLGVHINDAAGTLSLNNRDDLEFLVLDFNDHMAALNELHAVVKQVNPSCRFIVTVSPIPLQATFSGQDVVLANMYSKSTLRSVAGAFCAAHDDADYFPSFEMVMYSDPAVTWMEDRRHVRNEHVATIIETFVEHYIQAPSS